MSKTVPLVEIPLSDRLKENEVTSISFDCSSNKIAISLKDKIIEFETGKDLEVTVSSKLETACKENGLDA